MANINVSLLGEAKFGIGRRGSAEQHSVIWNAVGFSLLPSLICIVVLTAIFSAPAQADCTPITGGTLEPGTVTDITCSGSLPAGNVSKSFVIVPLVNVLTQLPTTTTLTVKDISGSINSQQPLPGIEFVTRGGNGSFSFSSGVRLPGFGGNMRLNVDPGVNITRAGAGAYGIRVSSTGGNGYAGPDGGIFNAGGNPGGSGFPGGTIDIRACSQLADGSCDSSAQSRSTINTQGDKAHGIYATSTGGNGGDGEGAGGLVASAGDGGAGAPGGSVTIESTADISTEGDVAYGILAESLGGTGGNGGKAGALFYAEGGSGAPAGAGGDVSVTNYGNIQTQDAVTTLFDQDVFGLVVEKLDIGFATIDVPVFKKIKTLKVLGPDGDGSHGIYARSLGGLGGAAKLGGGLVSTGGDGGGAGLGGSVSIRNEGDIVVAGKQSRAIFAESIGGGGGRGALGVGLITWGGDGRKGGDGGDVFVQNTGQLITRAAAPSGTDDVIAGMYGAQGIFAQSVGGGGGNGGDAVAAGLVLSVAIGGNAGDGGKGGKVQVVSRGKAESTADYFDIDTLGSYSHGILAQSVGGGGGTGGGAISVAVGVPKVPVSVSFAKGGSGGRGGVGDVVTVGNSSKIRTTGVGAYGILGQSIGGGGGDGGYSFALAASAGKSVGSLSLSFGGKGGSGGSGDQVTVDNVGAVSTVGQKSHGIVAQSVGGGGGSGGFAGAGSIGFGSGTSVNLAVSVGGAGGGGGNSGKVTVTNRGDIETRSDQLADGDLVGAAGCETSQSTCQAEDAEDARAKVGGGSIGILAQSIGGGGGEGGFSFAGSFGASTGGKTINVGAAVGGSGGQGGYGGTKINDVIEGVEILNLGKIDTYGESSHGILAQSVGGGGGLGGSATAVGAGYGGLKDKTWNVNLTAAVGGTGGGGNSGGLVKVENFGDITTRRNDSRGIFAQSIGGGGGDGGKSFTANIAVGAQGKGHTANGSIRVGGSGGSGNIGEGVIVINDAVIDTGGDKSDGIFAQSIGGGGGNGGKASGFALRLETNPLAVATDKFGWTKENTQKVGTNWNFALSVGGDGGNGNKGGQVVAGNLGDIVTRGAQSRGILAQSIGGGGGTGGEGNVATGIDELDTAVTFLDSPGGTGSFLGKKLMGQLRDLTITVGGDGGINGHGGLVEVVNEGSIETYGYSSEAIFSQSIGGGGGIAQDFIKENTFDNTAAGIGGDAVGGATGKLSFGGAGGAAGNGGDVRVENSGRLFTDAKESAAIFAQSVGGGGGVAGNVDRALADSINFGLGLGFARDGGGAGNGGDVTVTNSGDITTMQAGSDGVFAQSVGGGGGKGGDTGNSPFGSLFVGSVGGSGSAGIVTVNHDAGTITTNGAGSHGIFAQSAGGEKKITTLGLFDNLLAAYPYDPFQFPSTPENDFAEFLNDVFLELAGVDPLPTFPFEPPVELTEEEKVVLIDTRLRDELNALPDGDIKEYLDDALNGLNLGSAVDITVAGDVIANGADAHGIFAQSRGGEGNGRLSIGISGTVQGGSGTGAGVYFDEGENNALVIGESGVLTSTLGASGLAIQGGAAVLTVDNYGVVAGSVDLGTNTNRFTNRERASFYTGARVDIGAGNLLRNFGMMSPGNPNQISSTSITGNLLQGASGVYVADLDLASGLADRINVSGTSTLGGSIALNRMNIGLVAPTSTEITLFSSAGGILDRDSLQLSVEPSAVISYELLYPNENDVVLSYSVDFAPKLEGVARNKNRDGFGEYINSVQTVRASTAASASSDAVAPTALSGLTEWIVSLPDAESLGNAYDQFIPSSLGNLTTEAGASSIGFNDAMHSCRQRTGDYRFIAEGRCGWGRIDIATRDQDETTDNPGYRLNTWSVAGGGQYEIGKDTHLGFAGTLGRSDIDADLSETTGTQIEGGLILKRRFNALMLSGSLSAGYGSYDTRRQAVGATAFSNQDMYIGALHGRISYDFQPGSDMYIRPLFDVGVTQVNRKAFDESGAGAANLSVDKERDTITTLQPAIELGGEFATKSSVLVRPFVRLGLTYYAGGSNTREVSAGLLAAPDDVAPFTVSTETDDTYGDLVLGLEFFQVSGASIRLEYAGQLSDNTQAHAGALKFQIPF